MYSRSGRSVLFFMMGVGIFLMQGCGQKQEVPADGPKQVLSQDTEREATPAPEAAKKNIGAKTSPSGVFRGFPVYTDEKSPDNHYMPTGWMGDFGDLKLDPKCMVNPHGGTTCIEIIYNNKATQGARWAGIYWQNPPNNWGTRPGGYDLTGAKKLSFWVRGNKGGERIEEFKVGGITGEYADTDVAGIGPVLLTPEWKQLEIDLDGKDLSSISGGFAWATNLDANPDGATFYMDDIKFE